MSTLYELTDEYKQVLEMLDDPEIDEQTIADTLESIGGEIEDKADGYAKVMQSAKAEVEGIKAEISRLSERKSSIEHKLERMKQSLQGAMEATGKTKFKTLLFSFNIQKNPPSVAIEDGAKLPDKYLIPQPEKIDKKSIIADLKAGAVIEGCTLTQTESLRIR